ncbi:hypothetical protein JOS77_29170 [Chromobacterium haemolyticum]|nr:hypothetical protein JOS77_29170 [Chromobacterium haemolyticum]
MNYQEITEKYKQYNAKRNEHWQSLYRVADLVNFELHQSLELPAAIWTDNDGQQHRYVELGTFQNGKFDIKPSHMLERDGLSIKFAIRVTLEEGPSVLPKQNIAALLSVRQDGSRLEFTIDGPTKIILHTRTNPQSGDLSEVVEAIKKQIIAHLDESVFG